ncbi:dihydrodipicolinate synthase family protein [Paenibacillus sp. YPG26]|uniref:dihydrodipicolinate synthase family protein n=1 Tax=Paenibacillus sp. YPG26 TaxID=2878915 RepID=UPI00203B6192|nr:dihydrodipicolinate synthase family protein [Paenibacillus sp. YPG26]USB31936.1 dihydrodipicolinate synthase family protein [Paenibacillus sp. YPG26]
MRDYKQIREQLTGGIIPAVPVPRSADRSIHTEAHEKYAQYMAAQRILGVALWVHTGRGLQLTRPEREYIIRCWRSALKPEQTIVAGVGSLIDSSLQGEESVKSWLSSSHAMAADAMGWGADALLVFPPVIFRDLPAAERDEAIIAYHQSLADQGYPLILFYLYEQAGGIKYTTEVLERLLKLPQVIGIKLATLDSVMTMQDVSTLLMNHFPDKLNLTGEDRMFGYSLMRGAKSALVGLGAAFPNIQADLIQAYKEGNYVKFMDLSARIDGFAEAAFVEPMDKYILRMLWCLVLAGVIPPEAAGELAGYEMTQAEIAVLRQAISSNQLY